MKKIISLFICIALVFSLAACSSAKPAETSEKETAPEDIKIQITPDDFVIKQVENNYHNQSCDIVKTAYDEITLNDSLAETFPKLAEALEKLNNSSADINKANQEDLVEQADDRYAEDPEFFEVDEQYYSFTTKAEIKYASEKLVSLLISDDFFAGGAHPTSSYRTVNIEPGSGRIMNITDIADTEKLPEIIESVITEKYGADAIYEETDISDYCEKCIDNEFSGDKTQTTLTWTLDDENLIIYFSPYEIAAYAWGLLTAELPVSEYSDIINF